MIQPTMIIADQNIHEPIVLSSHPLAPCTTVTRCYIMVGPEHEAAIVIRGFDSFGRFIFTEESRHVISHCIISRETSNDISLHGYGIQL